MESMKTYPLASSEAELSLELIRVEKVDAEEKISYTTYGLRLLDHTGNTIYCAEDIDTQMEDVDRFIRLCSENDVRAIHLPDLLEDYLGY